MSETDFQDILFECRHLSKSYGKDQLLTRVFDDFNFTLEKGSMNVIVGASGSGKSTLLHLLAGLDLPDTGQLLYQGKDIAQMSENERCRWRGENIGFIYQFHHLLNEFTVLENVLMPVWVQGKEDSNSKATALRLIEEVGLGEKIKHKPTELSGGEQQRVAICRAFITQPGLILADEPSGNLDEANAKKVADIFFRLKTQEKFSVLVATHNLAFAARFDNIYRLHAGTLEKIQATESGMLEV